MDFFLPTLSFHNINIIKIHSNLSIHIPYCRGKKFLFTTKISLFINHGLNFTFNLEHAGSLSAKWYINMKVLSRAHARTHTLCTCVRWRVYASL